jgi:hypothetical protein
MSKINKALVITHWVGATPDVLWNAYSTPELFHQFFSPEGLPEELIDNPEVLEAFRSSFRKLGRVLNVNSENR